MGFIEIRALAGGQIVGGEAIEPPGYQSTIKVAVIRPDFRPRYNGRKLPAICNRQTVRMTNDRYHERFVTLENGLSAEGGNASEVFPVNPKHGSVRTPLCIYKMCTRDTYVYTVNMCHRGPKFRANSTRIWLYDLYRFIRLMTFHLEPLLNNYI